MQYLISDLPSLASYTVLSKFVLLHTHNKWGLWGIIVKTKTGLLWFSSTNANSFIFEMYKCNIAVEWNFHLAQIQKYSTMQVDRWRIFFWNFTSWSILFGIKTQLYFMRNISKFRIHRPYSCHFLIFNHSNQAPRKDRTYHCFKKESARTPWEKMASPKKLALYCTNSYLKFECIHHPHICHEFITCIVFMLSYL